MIYFVQVGVAGPIKIGHTTIGPERRLKQLRAESSPWARGAMWLRALLPGDESVEDQLEAIVRPHSAQDFAGRFGLVHPSEWYWPTPDVEQILELATRLDLTVQL